MSGETYEKTTPLAESNASVPPELIWSKSLRYALPFLDESETQPPRSVDDGPLAWQKGALCAQTDPEAFFPEKGSSVRNPKEVCKECDVREACLEYALQNNEEFGVWGGLSAKERKKLRTSRNRRP